MSADRYGNLNHQPAQRQAAELLWSLGQHVRSDPSRRATYGSPPAGGSAATANGGAYGAPNSTPSTGVPSGCAAQKANLLANQANHFSHQHDFVSYERLIQINGKDES